MKRQLFIVLALAVGLMVKAETPGNWIDNKAGSFETIKTGEKTITITSAAELALLAYNIYTDGTYRDYTITLSANLDLSGHYWIPIGTITYPFIGTFNGGGNIISNLDVYVDGSETGNVAGLFGQIGVGGTVKDVIITSGPYIGVQNPTASCYIGGIAGINNGTITGCANAAEVKGNHPVAYVGGIAGENTSTGIIQNCYNLGSLYTSETDNHIGGLVGNNSGNVKNCFTRCTITAGGGTVSQSITAYPLVGNNAGTIAGCFYANGSTYNPLTPEIRALSNNADNAAAISSAAAAGTGQNILLNDRTLFTDGGWNTLCLPFSIPAGAEGYSPIAGAQVKTLSSSSFAAGTLTLNFENATSIEAGKPYIVKWNTAIADSLANPVFMGVTVSSGTTVVTGTNVEFRGTFDPIIFGADNKNILFMGEKNKLYYPQSGASIGAFRAYFILADPSEIKSFALNFDDDTTTGVTTLATTERAGEGSWYDLSGRKMVKSSNRPISRGVYIHNGKKIIIK